MTKKFKAKDLIFQLLFSNEKVKESLISLLKCSTPFSGDARIVDFVSES